MKHEVLCGWLGLTSDNWPPDHYTLLGLRPGESDLVRIEQSVHERMARLRCYQCSNPELVTEGMNRLAQAFLCLTDAKSKGDYDAGLRLPNGIARQPQEAAKKDSGVRARAAASTVEAPPRPAPPVRSTVLPAALQDTAIASDPKTQVEWKISISPPPVRGPAPGNAADTAIIPASQMFTPPPVRIPPSAPAIESSVASASEAIPPPLPPVDTGSSVAPAAMPPPTPAAEPPAAASGSGPLAKYKGFSPGLLRLLSCRHGLGTKKALYRRIRKTRRLLYAWERAGKFLRKPKRKLQNPAEEKELARALAAIGEHLRGFPRFLGRPGQPGYRIAARARVAPAPDWLNALDDEQRGLLAQDWAAGQTLLSSHRQFLRKETRSIRGLSGGRLVVRAIVCDLPWEGALLAVALVVLLILLALGSR
jgi:hypothetical protein